MKNTWEEKWIEDIDYLYSELKNNHINLFAYTKEEVFNEKVENLKNIINNLDFDDMKVEVSRVVASIKDAHTSMVFPAKKFIPLKFYYFEDGVYVIDTTNEYETLLFKKVNAIEGMEIDKVINELKDIISFENEYFFKAQAMKYLQIADVLYGLLVTDYMDKINIYLDGVEYEIKTVSYDELIYTNTKVPYYCKNSSENLWFEKQEDKSLYIKYNSCREYGDKTIKEKTDEIIEFIESEQINSITIDLRHNLGGDSRLFDPFIDYLRSNNFRNVEVIIGRETFSSGLLNAFRLKNRLRAKIKGEPSGGKPNCYGEIKRIELPNSKFIITYSTNYYDLLEDDSIMALYPDEAILESITDYINSKN